MSRGPYLGVTGGSRRVHDAEEVVGFWGRRRDDFLGTSLQQLREGEELNVIGHQTLGIRGHLHQDDTLQGRAAARHLGQFGESHTRANDRL